MNKKDIYPLLYTLVCSTFFKEVSVVFCGSKPGRLDNKIVFAVKGVDDKQLSTQVAKDI